MTSRLQPVQISQKARATGQNTQSSTNQHTAFSCPHMPLLADPVFGLRSLLLRRHRGRGNAHQTRTLLYLAAKGNPRSNPRVFSPRQVRRTEHRHGDQNRHSAQSDSYLHALEIPNGSSPQNANAECLNVGRSGPIRARLARKPTTDHQRHSDPPNTTLSPHVHHTNR